MTEVGDHLRAALTGRYTIERELGRGGSATVYLAQDLRHHRRVAIKVLRPVLAAALGPERFLREIEVAARLQHPNILPLFDSGQADGVFYYVMPFVEGESLSDRLARQGKLSIEDAVRILLEVADALSYAHAHGVVHRDIKPGNVLLSGRHALVADFGVAKAVSAATDPALLTSGEVMFGTPAYMAPEQATADPHQDHRVDIYALGALGYQVLTGRTPFVATTAQEMLAAHVTSEPEPVERYRSAVSPALSEVVRRCLEKKPADRWQTAAAVLEQLQPLVTPSGGTTPAGTRPGIRRGRLLRWTAIAIAVAVAAIVLLLGRIASTRPVVITVSDIKPVTSEPGIQFEPAISPDGKTIAYAAGPIAATHLVIKSTAGPVNAGEVNLADTSLARENLPQWRVDGEAVRFWGCRAAGCVLYETDKLGGSKRPVTVPAHPGDRFAWSPDGSRVAFVNADTIFTADAGDTVARRVAIHTRDFWGLHSLAWSPNGSLIAYVSGNPQWRTSVNLGGPTSIWLVPAAGGEPRQVIGEHLNVSPAWLDDSHLLFVSNRDGPRAVYVVEVGPQGPRGEPHIIPGIADPHSISYSIASRTLTFAKFSIRQNIWTYPLVGHAQSIRAGRPVTTGDQYVEAHDVSADGKWIAFDNGNRGSMNLFKMPAAGGDVMPLTDAPWDEESPRWSPDGTEIAFYVGRAGTWSVWVMPANGGVPVAIPSSAGVSFGPIWSPDGLRIAYVTRFHGRPECWLVSRDSVGGMWHTPVHLTDFPCFADDWTRDGSGFVSPVGAAGAPDAATVVLVGKDGRVTRRALPAARRLHLRVGLRYSRDGTTLYDVGTHEDGRQGVWAIPVAGGEPGLAIAFDDPALVTYSCCDMVSVGNDHLYLTVAQYESEIWVARLRY